MVSPDMDSHTSKGTSVDESMPGITLQIHRQETSCRLGVMKRSETCRNKTSAPVSYNTGWATAASSRFYKSTGEVSTQSSPETDSLVQ